MSAWVIRAGFVMSAACRLCVELIPTGVALGAEVRGLDLSQPMDDRTFATIEHAHDEHGVFFFRDQRITPEQQVAFTRRFGEIEFNIFGERWGVPGCPEIVVVSNITDNGRPIGIRRAGENWHSDMCYMRARRAVFDFTACKRSFPPTREEIERNPPVRHPIVRTHPTTGRKCLYVMRDDCTGI